MATKRFAVFLMIFCTLFTTLAQLSYKFGLNKSDVFSIVFFVGLGLAFYGVGAVLLTFSLKFGELSVLYPIIATGFVWVALFGIFLFDELVSLVNWFGIGFIIFGVVLLGLGGRK